MDISMKCEVSTMGVTDKGEGKHPRTLQSIIDEIKETKGWTDWELSRFLIKFLEMQSDHYDLVTFLRFECDAEKLEREEY